MTTIDSRISINDKSMRLKYSMLVVADLLLFRPTGLSDPFWGKSRAFKIGKNSILLTKIGKKLQCFMHEFLLSVVVCVLLFYVHSKHLRSCWDAVNLTTLFLGSLDLLSS